MEARHQIAVDPANIIPRIRAREGNQDREASGLPIHSRNDGMSRQNAEIQTSATIKPTIANDVDADRLPCVVHRASERIMSTCFHSMVDFADKFVDLVNDQSQWSQATFGSDSDRGPMGALKHLEKEARECQEAVGTPELREELADCLLLLLDASRRAGIKPAQLVEAAQAKMVKNKERTWPKPTSDEPVEHVR